MYVISPLTVYSHILTLIATYSTMVGGVISDIYHAEDRNTPMALFAGAALFGTGLGPLIAGNIVARTSWRWIYWSHGIVSAGFVIFMYFFLKETRGSILLSRKARALNKWYDSLEEAGYYGLLVPSEEPGKRVVRRIRWKVKADEERQSIVQMISVSCYRPFRKTIMPCILVMELTGCRFAVHGACCFLFFALGSL